MKKWVRILKKHRKQILVYMTILILLMILISIFFNTVKMIAVIVGFTIVNSLIRFYRRILTGLPVEFEVCILGTVVVTIAYGIGPGILTALFCSIFSEFFNQYISPFSLVNIIVYALIPFAAVFLDASSIVYGGFLIVVIANIIIFIIFTLLGYDIIKNIGFSITNIILNYFIFSYLAIPVLRIVS